MSLSKKVVRKIAGLTFDEQGSDPDNWFNRACAFNEAAILLNNKLESSLTIPFYYNAGLSIELILKAIILAKSKAFETNHNLVQLSGISGIVVTKDQECTLELLSEMIVWNSRYPIPKKEGQWNNFHDVILEKHIIRESEGDTYRTLVHKGRFPLIENYTTIWDICNDEYKRTA